MMLHFAVVIEIYGYILRQYLTHVTLQALYMIDVYGTNKRSLQTK